MKNLIENTICVLLILSIIFFIFVCETAVGQDIDYGQVTAEEIDASIIKWDDEKKIFYAEAEAEYDYEFLISHEGGVAKELTNVKILNPVITFNDIFEYAEECYNDSIHIEQFGWTVEDDGHGHGQLVGYPIYDTLYYYIEPTFEGFYKWLKEKKQ